MLDFYLFTVITNIVVMSLTKIRTKYNPKIKAAAEEFKKAIKDSDPWIIKKAKDIFYVAFPILNILLSVVGLLFLLSSEDTVVYILHKATEKELQK